MASIVTVVASFPIWIKIPFVLGLFFIVAAACMASWGAWGARRALATASASDAEVERRRVDRPPLPQRVADKVVWAGDYGPLVHDRTFTRCEIHGKVYINGGDISHSKWLLGSFDVVNDPATDLPPGTLRFDACKFLWCEFQDCTAVGTPEQVASVKALFGLA